MNKRYILSLSIIPFLVGGAHTADASRHAMVSVYHPTSFGLFRLLTINGHALATHIAHRSFIPQTSNLADSLLK